MADERFQISEWYGHPFEQLGDWDRVRLARHKVGVAPMPKADQLRLAALETIADAGPLAAKDATRLAALRAKLALQQEHELPCPFKINIPNPTCSKPGGVCSIRPYTEESGVCYVHRVWGLIQRKIPST